MNEIIHMGDIINNETKSENVDLAGFSEEVRSLFDKLSNSIKELIFSEKGNDKKDQEKTLEEIIASFDQETREAYLNNCLFILFHDSQLRQSFDMAGEENLRQEIMRLLDLLWSNRGKRGDNIKIFNQELYDNFFAGREIIINQINNKKDEIAELKKSIQSTVKQKRLTESKQEKLNILNIELNTLNNSLERYDEQKGNSSFDYIRRQDVSTRRKKEKMWTEATITVAEYMDPVEFATAVAEQMEHIFHLEYLVNNNPGKQVMGRDVSSNFTEKSQKIVNQISRAIEDWNNDHDNEGCLKVPTETKTVERQGKMIDYFISLVESYKRGKEIGRTDAEMIYSIRQMEVTLTLLGKIK